MQVYRTSKGSECVYWYGTPDLDKLDWFHGVSTNKPSFILVEQYFDDNEIISTVWEVREGMTKEQIDDYLFFSLGYLGFGEVASQNTFVYDWRWEDPYYSDHEYGDVWWEPFTGEVIPVREAVIVS